MGLIIVCYINWLDKENSRDNDAVEYISSELLLLGGGG